MSDILNYPEIQSVVLPFLAALAVGWIAHRTGVVGIGLGIVAGFIVTVLFVNGVTFLPLTGARKIIVIGLVAACIGAVADARHADWRERPAWFAVLSVVASAWVLGIVMLRKSGMDMLVSGAGIIAYTAWVAFWVDHLRAHALRSASVAVALGLGTGFCAIAGASALFGQLALAVSASAGAVMLLAILLKKDQIGGAMTLPVGALLGLIGCATVAFADLAWITLVILGLIPLAAKWTPLLEEWSRWKQAIVLTISTTAVAGIAVAIAMYLSGGTAY